MSKIYGAFAQIYDDCMDEIPYDTWTNSLCEILEKYHIEKGSLICELGCGTGQMTRRLSKKGYDMIGIDNSSDMLAIAREKQYEDLSEDETAEEQILYLKQDMREFELYGTVAAIVSVCDTFNYLQSYNELVKVLKLADNYLDPKGILVFDLKTEHYYKDVVGDASFQDIAEDHVLIWENSYDEERKTNEYRLTMFLEAEETEDGEVLYLREEETHKQHVFSVEEIKSAVAEAGLILKDIISEEKIDDLSLSTRIYVICEECKKG